MLSRTWLLVDIFLSTHCTQTNCLFFPCFFVYNCSIGTMLWWFQLWVQLLPGLLDNNQFSHCFKHFLGTFLVSNYHDKIYRGTDSIILTLPLHACMEYPTLATCCKNKCYGAGSLHNKCFEDTAKLSEESKCVGWTWLKVLSC